MRGNALAVVTLSKGYNIPIPWKLLWRRKPSRLVIGEHRVVVILQPLAISDGVKVKGLSVLGSVSVPWEGAERRRESCP